MGSQAQINQFIIILIGFILLKKHYFSNKISLYLKTIELTRNLLVKWIRNKNKSCYSPFAKNTQKGQTGIVAEILNPLKVGTIFWSDIT